MDTNGCREEESTKDYCYALNAVEQYYLYLYKIPLNTKFGASDPSIRDAEQIKEARICYTSRTLESKRRATTH